MKPIPFAQPFIGKEEEEAILAVLRSGWLTTGRQTIEFEKEFAEFMQKGTIKGGSKEREPIYCMAVNSATSGLHLALEALGVGKGDLVLIPSMTFTATAEVVRYLGGEIVFVDVSSGSYHMDPAALEHTLERLKSGLPAYPPGKRGGKKANGVSDKEGFGPRGKAKAIIPVHHGGLPCDMDAILRIAKKYGLKVVEDAAHSFPSLIGNGEWGMGSRESPFIDNTAHSSKYAGTIGDVGVFSFYATKTLTTGEGGMVVTGNRKIADRIKIMRSHGIDRSIWNRYIDTKASWYYEVVEPGFKYNLPDLLSALGRVQLRRALDLLSIRQDIARRYDEAFRNNEHFSIPLTGHGDARHLYPLRLNLEKLSIARNEFTEKIQKEDIGISVHFIPLHIMPYYKKRYSLISVDFPETIASYTRSISLPIWPGMTESQINRVIRVVKRLGSEYTK